MKKITTTLLVLAVLMVTAFSASAVTPLPDQGVYRIQNVYSGTWVKLQHNYLADITAPTYEEASPLLVWYGERDENGESLLTNLSGDGGDMIETLEFIKGLIEETLEYNNKPTWFLEEMFQLHLVPTGDTDGSVFLCVDVPEIEDWEEIRDIILEAAGGQTAVTYYITHMHPGNRHYMGIDYDGSFGYRLEAGTPEGTDIKFLMVREDLQGGYCFVKTASTTAENPYLRRVHEKTSTVDLAQAHNDVSAVFDLAVDGIKVNRLAVQGLDLAPLAQAIEGSYLALCPTNTTAEKFVYDAYALKLQLPDEGVNALNVVSAATQALGENSEIVAALESHSDLIKDRAAIYFVHSDNGGITIAGDANYAEYGDDAKWKIEMIDTHDNYLAPAAEVEANGKYYTTLYTAFPYELVGSLTAYSVLKVGEDGVPQMEELEMDVIPAGTPVLLEMETNNDENHMIMPVAEGKMDREAPKSMLKGTYFDDDTENDKTNMLTLQGGLNFAVNNNADYMPANKAWADKTIPTAITTIGNEAQNDNTIYDLMGRKVTNPTHGIYIQGGKKVMF